MIYSIKVAVLHILRILLQSIALSDICFMTYLRGSIPIVENQGMAVFGQCQVVMHSNKSSYRISLDNMLLNSSLENFFCYLSFSIWKIFSIFKQITLSIFVSSVFRYNTIFHRWYIASVRKAFQTIKQYREVVWGVCGKTEVKKSYSFYCSQRKSFFWHV